LQSTLLQKPCPARRSLILDEIPGQTLAGISLSFALEAGTSEESISCKSRCGPLDAMTSNQ
jgi:hypothetical protein